MTIANKLRKISIESLVEKVGVRTIYDCAVPTTPSLGQQYLATVVRVFIANLPENDDDIKAHLRDLQIKGWADTNARLPYKSANVAFSLGLLKWGYTPTKGEKVTAGSVLVHSLKNYTRLVVDVLCEEAIGAYENPPAEYVAHINIPGYSPMADEPAEFETAQAAWEWLADERREAEDTFEEVEDGADDKDEESITLQRLVANMRNTTSVIGVVYGPTPGYDGDHDLGLAYSVVPIED